MKRHLIIEGTAVYEIDEECMLRKRVDRKEQTKERKEEEKKKEKNGGV